MSCSKRCRFQPKNFADLGWHQLDTNTLGCQCLVCSSNCGFRVVTCKCKGWLGKSNAKGWDRVRAFCTHGERGGGGAKWERRHPLLAGKHSTRPTPTPRGGGWNPRGTHLPSNHRNQRAPLKLGANCFSDHSGTLRKTATQCCNTMSRVERIVVQCSPHTQSLSLEDNTRSTLSSPSEDWDTELSCSAVIGSNMAARQNGSGSVTRR